jgi:hypothetical protein
MKVNPPLKQAWNTWLDCLIGDDQNSIYQQIYMKIWDTAIFRMVLESRRIQVERNPDAPDINAHFHSFIDRNFFEAQTAFIRRITDEDWHGFNGEKGVYSLGVLIQDICNRRVELTRQEYFNLRGLPYDCSALASSQSDFISQMISEGKDQFVIPRAYDPDPCRDAHITFDRLSGVSIAERSPQDIILETVFSKLKIKLEPCQKITEYVNKHIAHSATPESRKVMNARTAGFDLNDLWQAHRSMCEVAEFLVEILAAQSHLTLPWPGPDFFDNWEAPLIQAEDIELLREAFEQYEDETGKWRLDGVQEIWRLIQEK